MSEQSWCQHCGLDTEGGSVECETCRKILDGYVTDARRARPQEEAAP